MGQLYLLRYEQSTWNLEDRFTGWADVPLTESGEHEMWLAGEKHEAEAPPTASGIVRHSRNMFPIALKLARATLQD